MRDTAKSAGSGSHKRAGTPPVDSARIGRPRLANSFPQSGAHTEAMINMMSVHYSRGDMSVHFHPSVRIEDAARLRLLISAWAVGVPHEGGTDDGD